MITEIRTRYKLLNFFLDRLPTEELLKANGEDFGIFSKDNHIKRTCFRKRSTTDFLYVRPGKSSVLTAGTGIDIGGFQGFHGI